ncbi:putative disease resistance protein RGA3 [Papaver somniferum]|uniref:putative disease resistance protein RGA3 n=1 Tax=Papaver somniferum TaxID=3469 RepID=UPI000E7038E9|nr:putative disease resistance protein RGA3 [Papaver somniferum]
MGGLGKTTLAQKVFNDRKIMDYFVVRCWICVSDDFSPAIFFRIILRSLGEEVAHDRQTLDYLRSRLQKKLVGKRFLVVLDDVWNEDKGTWDTLKTSLSCGEKGSFIVVTTRLRTVALLMATLPHYLPRILSEEDCWSLFKGRAFMHGEDKNFPELEAVGKEIVKKCCGIPLAAKALGGLLQFKREEKQWLNVKDSQVWELQDNSSDAILPALQLSYTHLSSQSKQCFAYCSIYPKDYLMKKEELILLWMANGFIQSTGKIMEYEDVGNEIFNDLSWRSFFQDFQKDEGGDVISCKMHDLMHDIVCSVMSDECVSVEGDYNKVSSTTRYVSYKEENTDIEYSFLETMLRIREFRLVPSYFSRFKFGFQLTFLRFIFSNLECLRVLSLAGLTISRIPNSISKLKHLRYVNLSETNITSLPKDFCRLINLQVLKLHGCHVLKCLPSDLRKMTNLRHLDITGCYRLKKMAIEMGKLISLRTLSLFVVGKEPGCGITELKDLQHLKGRLRILGLEHVKSAANARNANLIQKKHLQSLYLCWSSGLPDTEEEEQAQLMVGEGLQPHPKLKRFYIDGYGGVRFPHWIGVGVSLVEITLWECHKCEHLPQLGNLPLLKILRLDNLHSVKSISEFYHHGDQVIPFFPSLEELYISGIYHQSGKISSPCPLSHIYRMYHFEKISSPSPLSPSSSSSQSLSSNQVLSFPRLRILEIRNCPELASFISLPPSLEMLVLTKTHEELLLRYLKQSPSSLERLEIGGFPNLVSVQNNGLRDLANLRELKISGCPELDFQNLISLRSLELHSLDKIRYFPPLPLLTSLRINYCSGLTTLEEWMPNLTSLQYLVIENCKNLNSLSDGLQRLTELVDLRILDSKNLKSLPDDGLERLTALRFLIIKNCHPDLHRQCRNEEGHYWDKISHIPELRIF